MNTESYQIDLTTCENEPIHTIGSIQPIGFLVIAAREDGKILHVSKNVEKYLHISPQEALLKTLPELFPQNIISYIKNTKEEEDKLGKFEPLRIKLNSYELHLYSHSNDGNYLIEFEEIKISRNRIRSQSDLTKAIHHIQLSQNIKELLQNTVVQLRQMSGYDRVMIYQFDEEWNGHVCAEAKKDELEPYLGLHYPASDIPKRAREMYDKVWFRLIYDTHSTPIPIVSVSDREATLSFPDLTYSILRGVSPIHVEYLINMGVRSTMSIAINVSGKLWGLFAFHHMTPRLLDASTRISCHLTAKVFANILGLKITENVFREKERLQQIRIGLINRLRERWDVADSLVKGKKTILDINSSQGAALRFDGKWYLLGDTPQENDLDELLDWTKTKFQDGIFVTHKLPLLYPQAKKYKDIGAGLLAIEISNRAGDCIFWFKPEKVQEIYWAGNPEKTVSRAENGYRLSPRKSFDKWREVVKFHSSDWKAVEISKAQKLGQSVISIVIEEYSELKILNRQLQDAMKDLEIFSYSISHDLRAPLRSMEGFAEILIEDYSEILDEDGRELLNILGNSAKEMNQMIDEILLFSKLNIDNKQKERIELHPIITNLVKQFTAEYGSHHYVIYKINSMPKALGDRTLLKLLFQNLISNAIKYSRYSDPSTIEIGGSENNEEIIYYVKDNGIGVEEEHKQKIFNLFVRIADEEKFKGTGVGLAFAKRIVEKHGGKIWVESDFGEGATFYFILPKN